jgi:hypothetical protein
METDEEVIGHTKAWINKVVIGCNFCPFAAREMKRGSIHFKVLRSDESKTLLQELTTEVSRLDKDESIATTLIILPGLFPVFRDYLDMITRAEKLLKKQRKKGIYQIASFHPEYLFTDAPVDDPANYTNRSVYPMIHLLRESGITEALANFPSPEDIPKKNIDFARQKGLAYMQVLWKACFSKAE